MHYSTWVLWYQQELILKRSSFSLLTWAHWFLQFLMVIRWDWYNKLKGEYPCPLWTYLVEVFVVRWILEKDPKLVFLSKPFMIGYIIENKYFDWIILSGRREKILGATERVCQLVQRSCWTLSTSLLTNQQFINCAFLERTPHLVRTLCPALLCAYPVLYARASRTLVRTIAPRFSKVYIVKVTVK